MESRDFRNALGQFATGVCVITTQTPSHGAVGMTVNSFAAVSLDPALVLWSIQNNSECFSWFADAPSFGINVLAHDQMALSNRYASKNNHTLLDSEYRIGRTGCPVLKGCLASFECQMHEQIDGGDHTILVGNVLAMEQSPADKQPLLFFSGKYRELH